MRLYYFFYIGALISLVAFGTNYVSDKTTMEGDVSTINLALRNAGHELLLANKDSTSLILPIKGIGKNNYQLSFESELVIVPDSLKNAIKRNFDKANLGEHYLVEVVDCSSSEISYSYRITPVEDNNIVPCLGRELPTNCYLVNVYFQNDGVNNSTIGGSLVFSFLFFAGLAVVLQIRDRKKWNVLKDENLSFSTIGNYKFYKNQNQLVKEKVVIELTAKECELLAIFSEKQNQIVKREELIKRVWEDNGVVVGRSLDTYISKIRKKLKEDESIRLVNIHGVGYKLEIV